MNEKKIVVSKTEEEKEEIFLLRSISNRLAQLEERVIDMEFDKKQYRKKREEKEGNTLDIIKKEIQSASEKRELSLWVWVKDKALYIGITLLVVWLSTFIK